MLLHGLEGLGHESLRVGGHVAEAPEPVQVVGKLVLEVLEVLVGRLVVRVNHPDPSGVDQLRREGLNLFENKFNSCFTVSKVRFEPRTL